MYLSMYGGINPPSCTAGCEGSTEGSLGCAVVIVVDWNDLRAAPRIGSWCQARRLGSPRR